VSSAVVERSASIDGSSQVWQHSEDARVLTSDLARLGLLPLFDPVINSSALGSPKPEARIFALPPTG
jgi:hypothetical protein